MAQICAVVATSMNAKGKSFDVGHFLPRVAPRARTPRQSPEDMMAFLRAATMRAVEGG
jgi:hypothetical protein